MVMLMLDEQIGVFSSILRLLLQQDDGDFDDITEDELDLAQALDSGGDFVLH